MKNPVARTETTDLSSAAVTKIEGSEANTKEIASMEATVVTAEMEATVVTAEMEATAETEAKQQHQQHQMITRQKIQTASAAGTVRKNMMGEVWQSRTNQQQNPIAELYSVTHPNFLKEHPELNGPVIKVFDYLFKHPAHHPQVESDGGICLAVDAAYSKNPTLNISRTAYLRQNFGEDVHAETSKNENTCYRATYATACGLRTHGTSPRCVLFLIGKAID